MFRGLLLFDDDWNRPLIRLRDTEVVLSNVRFIGWKKKWARFKASWSLRTFDAQTVHWCNLGEKSREVKWKKHLATEEAKRLIRALPEEETRSRDLNVEDEEHWIIRMLGLGPWTEANAVRALSIQEFAKLVARYPSIVI